MISSVAANNPLSSAMRVGGQSAVSSGLSVNRTQDAAGTASQSGSGVNENFKNAVLDRIERFQRSGQTENTSPEDARRLADSVAQAAQEVRNVYGQEAANAFMANVLKSVDQKGFSQESLTDAVSSSVRQVAQTGAKTQLKELSESFNRDLGLAEDDPNAPEVMSFSRAVSDFFGLEKTEGNQGTTAQGLTADGRWGEVAVQDLSGDQYLEGNSEAARLALESSASFTLGEVGEGTVDGLVNFLREELGAAEAADLLAGRSGQAGFMSTMDQVIEKALKESSDPAAAAKLEQYLNNEVKGAINASSSLTRNQFGNVEFEGWSFSKEATADGQEQTVFTSSWRYTNRDDAEYVRSGQSRPAAAAEAAEEEEESTGSALGDLVKKISSRQAKTGELVDTQA